jgi:predicted lipoprotein with Yx(FWY)xxD motif
MSNRWWVTTVFAAGMLTVAACGSSSPSGGSNSPSSTPPTSPSSSPSSSASAGTTAATTVKTAKIGGATVLTNAKGYALYWFAPDTSTTSKCNGSCATYWPPVLGPVTESGIMGTFGTITRSDGSKQATYDGHPLYTFLGDHHPGEASGNNSNASGGVWHEMTESGSAAPASKSSSSSSSGGYGY